MARKHSKDHGGRPTAIEAPARWRCFTIHEHEYDPAARQSSVRKQSRNPGIDPTQAFKTLMVRLNHRRRRVPALASPCP